MKEDGWYINEDISKIDLFKDLKFFENLPKDDYYKFSLYYFPEFINISSNVYTFDLFNEKCLNNMVARLRLLLRFIFVLFFG